MPVYEYECADCGTKFEVIRPIKDSDVPINCQSCNSQKTKRALSHCFSHSEGKEVSSHSTSQCNGCAGGSCSSCH